MPSISSNPRTSTSSPSSWPPLHGPPKASQAPSSRPPSRLAVHWHSAADSNFMCHLAMLEGTGDGDGTTWLEPVTDDQYKAPTSNRPSTPVEDDILPVELRELEGNQSPGWPPQEQRPPLGPAPGGAQRTSLVSHPVSALASRPSDRRFVGLAWRWRAQLRAQAAASRPLPSPEEASDLRNW